MDIPEAIGQLEALPTTSAIADELVSMGIKAYQGIPTMCAIAVYIQETTGEHTAIGLRSIAERGARPDLAGITAYADSSGCGGTACFAPKVAQFVREFDEGQHPKLLVEEY